MGPERAGPIAGVVLAAGASVRMGRNKLLLPLEGESLLRRAVRRTAQAGLAPVLVVVGHDAERARAELGGLPCRPVLNPEHGRGQGSSVRAGLLAAPPEAVAAVIVLADMPLVTAAMIAEVAARYRRGSAPLVVSEYGGVLAPPTLYARALFAELEAAGEGCGKRVVEAHRAEAVTASWPAAALTDLDVPADYQRLAAELGAR